MVQAVMLIRGPPLGRRFLPLATLLATALIFREGVLLSTQRDPMAVQKDGRSVHKRDIRRVFHKQLRRLWEITPFLKRGVTGGPMEADIGSWTDREADPHTVEALSKRFTMYGFNFVPLVTSDINLICGLEILFLRPDRPGAILRSADIDNRLKTLFDSLKIPEANEDWSHLTPTDDKRPFFVLLEDDRLITKVTLETDVLLQDLRQKPDPNDTRLVITVRLRPYEMHVGNMPFG